MTIVTAPGRTTPGWDGMVHDVIGVSSPAGTVLSVPPTIVDGARRLALAGGLEALAGPGSGPDDASDAAPHGLGSLLGRPTHRLYAGTFRWTATPTSPEDLPDAGTWLPVTDPRVPAWLRPFGDPVLVALAPGPDADPDPHKGVYAAGVGIKRHDPYGHELAVGTEEPFRGRGLARRLTAQAARHVVAEGRVATYLHDPANTASAKVAEAAGFPDRGWKILGLWP